jgi:hypothetical protein
MFLTSILLIDVNSLLAKALMIMSNYNLSRRVDLISFKTFNQSPTLSCLKRRCLGYQGLSLLSRNQRQSGLYGKSSQVGMPIAPDRCATLLSILIIRSINSHRAAVSVKSCSASPKCFIPP